MARITSTVGLISGINTSQIIDELMQIESAQTSLIQTRINSVNNQKSAYTDLKTQLDSLQTIGQTLNKPSTFQNSATTSSDESVLTATAAPGAAVGTYQFQVARLVATQQTVTQGFANTDSALVGAGTLTIESGGGDVGSETLLNDLNGGAGVSRGVFRITDGSGASTTVDTSSCVTLDDVVSKINTSLDVGVKATVDGDHLKLTDTSGKTTANFSVQDVGTGTTATDLGIATAAAAGTPTVITGTDINYLGRSTLLNNLNDGRGVGRASTGNDVSFALSDGTTFQVSLASATSVGDVLDAINKAPGNTGGKLKADVAPGGNGIRLTDTTGSGGPTVTAVGTSTAAADLGLTTGSSNAGGVLSGKQVLAGIDTVLLSSLNGGQGISLGSLTVQDRSVPPASATIDLSAAKSVQDVLDAINSAPGIHVKAQLNRSGNGIAITDTSGGAGNLVIADNATSEALGLNGTFTSDQTAQGKNLQRQWVSGATQLSKLNGGKGVTGGSIKLTTAAGHTATIDLSDAQSVNDVIAAINTAAIGVTASVNAHGDGLLLTDTSGGAGHLVVADVDSTTAADLNIKGTATANTIDGTYEKTIDVSATDTLSSLQKKINDLNFGVTASIINDGTASSPYRLSLTAKNSGAAGRVVVDTGGTSLQTTTLVKSQDAAVFMGAAGSAQPLLITSGTNQITNLIKGVTVNLNGASDKPVTLNVTRTADNVVTQINLFVTNFNKLVDANDTYTKWNTDTNQGGVLLGDSTVQTIENSMYTMLNTVVPDGGKYRVLADIGITVGDGAKLQFDEDKFRAAYADDPDEVTKLFSATKSTVQPDGSTKVANKGAAGAIVDAITHLTDPVDGIISSENKTLDSRVQDYQDNITHLNSILADKRNRLELQFANMESVLSSLQSQQSALNSLNGTTSSSSSSK